MAKIVIEVDTDTSGINLSIDGEVIDGATYVCIEQYKNDTKPYISIDIPKQLDNGLKTMMRYYSSSEQISDSVYEKDTKTIKGFTGVAKLTGVFAELFGV